MGNVKLSLEVVGFTDTKIKKFKEAFNKVKIKKTKDSHKVTIEYKKKNSKIIIDYAHTPDALKKILLAYKIKKMKPSILFGCGGDRDKSKRKSMALIANKYADKIYITDDNPRNENPSKIRKNILKYCSRAMEVSDRRKAIKLAIKELKMNENLKIIDKPFTFKRVAC